MRGVRQLVAVLALAALGGASAQSSFAGPVAVGAPGVTVQVYLSSTGLGLLALPRQVVATLATAGAATPQQTVAGLLGSVDAGAGSQGWYMRGYLASPSVVNLGALNLTWQSGQGADYLGVRLGVLNTTVPILCDSQPHVVLQLDSVAGDYSARLSRVGAQSDVSAARVEYLCAR